MIRLLLITIFIFYSVSGLAFTIIAHKGFHNNHANRFNDCSTLNLTNLGSKHSENTINAVDSALRMGASMAEIDLRLTKDNKIVVFHDRSLECKTNGKGLVRDKTLAQLKTLDAYYNLSFDGGKSFPLRGRGRGKIQELSDYIKLFPNQAFHFNPKDKTKEEVESLISYLGRMTKKARKNSFFWGEIKQYNFIKYKYPDFGRFLTNGGQTRKCFNFLKLWYKVLNWSHLPEYCLYFKNITIDVTDYFPFKLEFFSKLFIKYNIQLWGYNVLSNNMLLKLKDIDWSGVITPRIGSVLKNE